MASGYIYIGGFQPSPDVLFIKAGKSGQLKDRMRAYRTMLPGGLTFMYAAKTATPSLSERELMTAILAIDGVEAVGGEWFRCEPLLRNTVVDELFRIGTSAMQVHVGSTIPFGCINKNRRGRRGRNFSA